MSVVVQPPASVTAGQWQQSAVWDIQAQGARARVSAFGGQLLSWQPDGADEVLWLSPQAAALPTPIRGGVPLCWPWFGRQGQAATVPAHGLARTQPWRLHAQQPLPDGGLELVLRPVGRLHPGLMVEQVLRVGSTLEQALVTTNTGEQPFALTQALHSYFRLDDVTAAVVTGLQGSSYIDALVPDRRGLQRGDWQFEFDVHGGRCDRIHHVTGAPVILQRGPGRRNVRISSQGSAALVLWTPGADLGGQMPDVGQHWRHFLCLEVANAGDDMRWLLPGQRHTLSQQLALQD